jgi:hypothetical protein
MKIKAITPLGEFKSVDITKDEVSDIISLLRESTKASSVQFPITKDKKTGVVLPCETVKNSVFVVDYRD